MAERPIQSSISFGSVPPTNPLAAQLRDAMSYWPSGVAVLAVQHRTRIEAITLSSFISVSLEPAIVLASIAAAAPIVPALNAAARFTVSILAGDQARAASSIADRFPNVAAFFNDDAGDPLLADALASIICTTSATHPAGDHVLYLGSVERVRLGREVEPLVYHRRKYRRLE